VRAYFLKRLARRRGIAALFILLWLGGTSGHELSFKHAHREEYDGEKLGKLKKVADAYVQKFHAAAKRTSDPTAKTNCHGLTFDKGESWIEDLDEIEKRIGKCKEVAEKDAQVDDVVVYRGTDGKITHTGRVSKMDAGKATVHSQWGAMGDFDHAVDDVPQGENMGKAEAPAYGKAKIYHCS
jgi:hypothetical protein